MSQTTTGLGRREFIAAMVLGGLSVSRAFAAADALGLGDKMVQVIVPFTPGTTPDLAARLKPEVAAGRVRFCLGYSDPESGSDIAAAP